MSATQEGRTKVVRIVKPSGGGAYVGVPRAWLGKAVEVSPIQEMTPEEFIQNTFGKQFIDLLFKQTPQLVKDGREARNVDVVDE
jgi:putative transposon-encoded protein